MNHAGIIFDLDGTLYHKPWFFKPMLFLALTPHGLRLPAYIQVRAECSGTDYGDAGALMTLLCRRLGEKVGLGPDSTRQWIHDAFYPAFVRSMRLLRGSRPGLEDLLRSLRKRGTRLAVLSDFARVRERLLYLDIDPALFDTISSCERTGALKPHPRPFTEIAGAWDITPDRILMVGDREDTDGAGAASAGMRFLRVSPKRTDDSGGDEWERVCAELR